MMVSSFIGSQKFTVQQTLERKFARYLTLPSDYFALLLSLLRQSLRAVQREQAMAGTNSGTIKIAARCAGACASMRSQGRVFGGH
jgi:DNA replication licensing factor MCM2